MDVNDRAQSDAVAESQAESLRDWDYSRLPEDESTLDTKQVSPEGGIVLPAIEDAAHLIARAITLPTELIKGVLHRGAKMVVGGGSKSYKTWLLLDLALSVATGQSWLGFSTQIGRVLYINLEIAPGFFSARIYDVGQARKVVLLPEQLDVWNLRGYATDLSSLVDSILQRIDQKYALIVVDPIYKVLGGRDENKAGDIAELLNVLERITVQSGAAVVFGAHFSKGNQAGKDSMDRIGGSGVFARDPDSILILTKHEEEDAFVVETILRNHPPLLPFAVRWKVPLLHRDDNLNPAKLKRTNGRGKTYTANDLLDLLPGAGLSTSQWVRVAKERLEMSPSTFHRLRRELRDTEKVIESPENRKAWIKNDAVKTTNSVN